MAKYKGKRMSRFIHTAGVMALLGLTPAMANDYIGTMVPDAQKVGSVRMTYMLWDVYDAALYAPQGEWSQDRPFALKLTYLRNLHGQKIADRSIKEMRTQGYNDEIRLSAWQTQMRDIFPEVKEGDVITGIFTADKQTVFISGEQEIGRINDPEFGQRFFDIWLNTKTSEPELRTALLGAPPANQNRKTTADVQDTQNTIRYGGARTYD